MHMSNCRCGHHKLAKLVGLLALLSAIGFWVAAWRHAPLFGIGHIHYFEEFVVFALIGISMQRGCSCCCGGCASCSVGKDMGRGGDHPHM